MSEYIYMYLYQYHTLFLYAFYVIFPLNRAIPNGDITPWIMISSYNEERKWLRDKVNLKSKWWYTTVL